MMHPSDADLLAHLDGELAADRAGAVATHLATCLPCRLLFQRMRTTGHACTDLIGRLDAAEPDAWRFDRTGSAPRGPVRTPSAPTVDILPRSRPVSVPRFARWRWAAGIALLLAGAGASATLLVHHGPARSVAGPRATIEEAGAPAVSHAGSVLVQPVEHAVHITITGAGPGLEIDAATHARPEVSIAVDGASTPRFSARDGQVTITLDDAATRVKVRFPATLRSGSILVDGQARLTVQNGNLLPGPAAGTTESSEPR